MEYPELDKTRRILELLYKELRATHERGDVEAQIAFHRRGPSAGLFFHRTRTPISKALDMSGAEAAALLRRLDEQGYIRLDWGTTGSSTNFSFVPLTSIYDKALILIGEWPNAEESLVHALQAASEGIENSLNIPDQQRRSLLEWFSNGVTLVKSVDGLAELIQRHWPV